MSAPPGRTPLRRSEPLAARLVLVAAMCACHPRTQGTMLMGRAYACWFNGWLDCQYIDQAYSNYSGEADPPARRWKQVVTSDFFACGIEADGTPACWGWNASGQTDIPDGLDVASFSVGYENTCALDPDGMLTCWGNVWTGLNEAPEGPFEGVWITENFGCAWSDESGWSCWGRDYGVEEEDYGVEGDGKKYTFVWDLPARKPAVTVAGGMNICSLDAFGRISCWGIANWGVTNPPEGTGWHGLSVGTFHACALDAGNHVHCWGDVEPWRRQPPGEWVSYTAGPRADCGIRPDGEIVCWGCVESDPFTCNWDN